MNTVFLGLGSNVDAERNIASGISALREALGTLDLSPVYRTPAMGFDGDDFINLAARAETPMSPLELKDLLHRIEDNHDRKRDVPRFSDRSLDIDILLYNDLCLYSPELEIPRQEILTSPHVLNPLADLAPATIHPSNRQTISTLWEEFQGERDGLIRIDLPL